VGAKYLRNITKILKSASGVLYGRTTAGTGRGEELTPAQVRTLISFDESVDDRVSALLAAGTNITITYNDAANTLTIASTAGGLSGTGSVDNAALRANGTAGDALQGSSIIINDNLTASPNNTVNHACIEATGGTTNVSISLKPKGSGSFSLHPPDGTSTGGNARGANAVDFQTNRNNAGQVASGSQSAVLGGGRNTASAQYATVIGGFANTASAIAAAAGGYLCSATAFEAFAFGYNATASAFRAVSMGNFTTASGVDSAAFGYGSTASATYALAHGNYSLANKQGQRAVASGRFSANGDSQGSELVVRRSTTTATQSELFLDGSSLRITIANDTTWAFECVIVGRRTDADNESAAYRITGCIDRNTNAASTSLVGTPTVTVISEDTAAWDVDAVADTTNGSLNFRVTGEAAKTIRWVGWVRLVEVTG